MALTPEDVVTKQFQHVRFKEGFDPDEVDDFLDEIVVERAFNHPCNCGARLRICKDDCRPFPLMPSLDVLAVHEVPVQAS